MNSNRTALVVDDDPGSRRLLVRLLEQQGWQVLEAPTGQAALERAENVHLDLVLMDLRMPGPVDGLQAAFLLRQNPLHQSVPIIAISASPYDAYRDQAFAAGCSAFLSKPVSLKQLRSQIERLRAPEPTA